MLNFLYKKITGRSLLKYDALGLKGPIIKFDDHAGPLHIPSGNGRATGIDTSNAIINPVFVDMGVAKEDKICQTGICLVDQELAGVIDPLTVSMDQENFDPMDVDTKLQRGRIIPVVVAPNLVNGPSRLYGKPPAILSMVAQMKN